MHCAIRFSRLGLSTPFIAESGMPGLVTYFCDISPLSWWYHRFLTKESKEVER